jgi:Holliday junction resolvase RusA-like endonuclease
MPAITESSFVPPSEVFVLPVCLAFVFIQVAMSVALFRQSRTVGRSREQGAADVMISFIRIIMQGEPQSLQAVRRNIATRSWYDPLGSMKVEMKRRISRRLLDLSENMPIFPVATRLKVDILFVARTNKDIDNMLKPFLDVLQGIVYENDSLIFEIHAKKDIISTQAVAAGASASSARVDVTISPM